MEKRANVSRRKFVQSALATSGAFAAFERAHAQSSATASAQSPGRRLRQLLQTPDVLQCPVIYDMVSLKLAAHLGFPAAFAGGSPISASMYGIGDFGWLTMTELIEFAARAAEATDMLVMADGDDGGGSPLNVHRTIRRFERVGVAAVMLEDMYGTKHVPGLPEGPLSSTPAFVDKIKAAVDARKLDLVVVARTDAMAGGEPFEKAVERVAAYGEAGADVVFVAGATVQQSPTVAKAANRPVMCIVPVDRPEAALDVLRESRVKMAAYSGQLLNVAARAVRDALVQLKQTGRMKDLADRTLPRADFNAITGVAQAVEVARRFNATRDPAKD
jgi:2-methylisocitrate lyase-like PEP mutase family enzyme